MNDHEPGSREPLAQAQLTIARQEQEIARLQAQVSDERFVQDLRGALQLAATTGTIAAPFTHTRLLDMIVETAAHLIGADAGALFLIDADAGDLIFEVALGQKAAEVKKFRVPLGHGIAGLVAVSGQPMAISDASSDPRQAADIARTVGYMPDTILCVPLSYNDEIIGVLELLNKRNASSFTPTDMEILGLFAHLSAVAIEQSRTQRNLAALISQVLNSLIDVDNRHESLLQRARSFAAALEGEDSSRRALDLATLVQEISVQGEHEAAACQAILQGFAGYLKKRMKLTGLEGY